MWFLPRPIVNMLGMEALRYFLLREIVFGQDGNFSYDALVTRYNSDLANGLGNLASRTATLIEKNFGGKIPKPGGTKPQDDALAREAQAAIGEVLERYEKFEFARALETIWEVIALADKYLTSEQPWALGNSRRRTGAQGHRALDDRRTSANRHGASASRLAAEHGKNLDSVGSESVPCPPSALDGLRWGQLAPGTQIGKAQTFFPRVDKTEAIERIEAMANEELNPTPHRPRPQPAHAPLPGCGSAAARRHRADRNRGFHESRNARRAR